MEPNKILSATLIDVIFDGRNKEYGAYELRKTYSQRTKTALSVTVAVVALVLAGTTLANSSKKKERNYQVTQVVELTDIADKKPPEKLPEPEKKPEVEQVQTQKFTPPEIVPDDKFTEPLPSIDELDSSRIGLQTREGIPDDGTPKGSQDIVDGKGIEPDKTDDESGDPRMIVEVPAKFTGNWINFLKKNLNAETPVNNGAGPGRYTVVVQFVVDKEGNVSEIKPLTNHGYGLEEEAVRVLRKAGKWEPAIQNGYKVKAYHKQLITFEVMEE
jgi:protein TonB